MGSLTGYQLALLARSQRWLPPALLYAVLVGASLAGNPQFGEQLGWNAAMLVPVLAWLTRLLLSAQPSAARAVLAAAAGAWRTQVAALGVALGCGVGLLAFADAVAGAVCVGGAGGATGPAAGVVCALTGSALGAVCAPPLVSRVGAGALALLAGSVLALVAPFSPANGAVRATFGAAGAVPVWPLPFALLVAAGMWTLSATAATRRAAAD